MKLNVGLFLTKRALLEPEKTAVINVDGAQVTFQQLNAQTNRLAQALTHVGINPGDRVGLLLMNSGKFLECFFALAKIGAIVVTLNFRLALPEIETIIKDSGLRTLLYGAEFAPLVEAITPRVEVREFICVGQNASPGITAYDALLAEASPSEPDIQGAGDDPLLIM